MTITQQCNYPSDFDWKLFALHEMCCLELKSLKNFSSVVSEEMKAERSEKIKTLRDLTHCHSDQMPGQLSERRN